MKIFLKTCLLLLALSFYGNAFGVETIVCPTTHNDMPLFRKTMEFFGKFGLCEYSDPTKGSCVLKYFNVRAKNSGLWKPAGKGSSFLECDASPEDCAFEVNNPSQPVESCTGPR